MLGRLATGTLQHKQDRMRAIRRPKHPAIEKKEKKNGMGERKSFWKTADPATAKVSKVSTRSSAHTTAAEYQTTSSFDLTETQLFLYHPTTISQALLYSATL
jgi:hypothetical protein